MYVINNVEIIIIIKIIYIFLFNLVCINILEYFVFRNRKYNINFYIEV